MPNSKTVQVGVWVVLQRRLCYTCYHNLLSHFQRKWQHVFGYTSDFQDSLGESIYISAETQYRQVACLFPPSFLHSNALTGKSGCNTLKQHIKHLSKGRDICSFCCSKGEEFISSSFFFFFCFQENSKYKKGPNSPDLIKYWALCNTKKRLHLMLLIFRHWCFQKNVPG